MSPAGEWSMVRKSQAEILGIIQQALESDEPISIGSSAQTVPTWDSLGQINIIVALDEAFGGRVSALPEMATAGSVKRILALLQSEGLVVD